MKNTPDVFSGPLDGLVILDLTRVLSGPYCTMLAADMGARVIKIEHPKRGDDTRAWGPPFLEGESAYYLSINRNKESVALDYTTAEGRAILDALIARADVLVENFRPGTLDDRGLGYREVSAKHPALIYVSISGFGQNGPRREEAGYDAMIQAESGLMSITGTPDGQAVRLGVAITDIASGMFAFQGLLLALIARGRTGRGQHVDLSLLDATASLLTYQAGRYFATGESPTRLGNRHATIVPYNTFDTADGVLVLAVGNDDQFQRLCRVAGLTDIAADPRFITNAGRVQHHDALQPLIVRALAADTAASWTTRLREAGVPCGAVRSVGEALTDPQILARAMVEVVDHPTIGPLQVLGVPVKLSETPGSVRTPPPRLGEHTAQVLIEDLGYSEARVAEIAATGAVRAAPTPGART
jgi:formyl-CoA transferase/CoA:oxalate CoA-transferase